MPQPTSQWCPNNSAHRATDDVPMMIPEVNFQHADLIQVQRQQRGWNKGFIAVKPNCSVQSYVTPVYALQQAGFPVSAMIVTTLQAVSGAGYPGPSSYNMIDGVVPYIGGEEEKSEREPQRILGQVSDGKVVPDTSIAIAAHCNRVPVIDGHMACVSLKFAERIPNLDEAKQIWQDFTSEPQRLELPSAPIPAMIYREEPDRPQPRLDRDTGGGMAVTLGRLRPCPVFDIRFVGLSHNTVRGAAGGCHPDGGIAQSQGLYQLVCNGEKYESTI